MNGDFSRSTFKPEKRYSGVRQQQGRVQLDADWNEQVDIDRHLRETGRADLIGAGGVPRAGNGFKVGLSGDASDLTLGGGRLYVDGILCELGADTPWSTQLAGLDPALDATLKPAPPTASGSYFAYADVWRRHVTALEDPAIRETALGGPDTCTRTQTFWQVKLVAVDAGSNCLSAAKGWQDVLTAPTGKLRARTRPGAPATEPCIVPANAGYTRLENQLYRVEVHEGGSLGKGATFKWSRENGSVVSAWQLLDSSNHAKLTVSDGRIAQMSAGDPQPPWVEVTDDVHEIQGTPGLLVQLNGLAGPLLTFPAPLDAGSFPVHPKVRLWNAAAAPIAVAADNDGWLPLEDGVEVHFEAGTYRTGDYWLIPARAFIGEFSGDIEWPRDGSGNPVALPPAGVVHHFAKLAVVDFDATKKQFANVRDCRSPFPAVTELAQLLYVGGDGQQAGPGEMLPEPLEARVANGRFPVPGVQVRFRVLEGKGRLDASRPGTTTTDPSLPVGGQTTVFAAAPDAAATIAPIKAAPIATGPIATAPIATAPIATAPIATAPITATPVTTPPIATAPVAGGGTATPGTGTTPAVPTELIVTTDAAGLAAAFWSFGADAADPRQRVEAVPLDAAGNPVPGQVVHFNASHAAQRTDPGVTIQKVTAATDKKPLDHDSLVNIGRFLDGIVVTTDRKLADTFSFPPPVSGTVQPPPFPAKPNFQVILHIPPLQIPTAPGAVPAGAGFQPLLLAGTVSLADPGVQWVPTVLCRRWLQASLLQQLDPNRTGFRLLVQVILKGRFIWSADDPSVFLDGEAFGKSAAAAQTQALTLPSGDGRKGSDFESWFWLVQDPIVTGPAGAPPVGPPSPGPVEGPVLTPGIPVLNPVLVNPVVVPTAEQPEAPAEASAEAVAKLTDLRGIGRARAAQLASAGIQTPADLAAADPGRVAEILGIPEETARGLVAEAGDGKEG
jgi:hypothetical protein